MNSLCKILYTGSGIFDLKIVDYDTESNSNTNFEMISCSQNANKQNLFLVDKTGKLQGLGLGINTTRYVSLCMFSY